jgi:hypothetical protein
MSPQSPRYQRKYSTPAAWIAPRSPRVALYLSSAPVDSSSGLHGIRSLLDREHPDWRDVLSLSG